MRSVEARGSRRLTSRRRILIAGESSFAVPRAEAGGLLVDARDYYVAFYRAALEARQTILITGWQFDRGVKLLRGPDVALARPMGGEVRFLPFLDALCKRRPGLHVYILAWDFHLVLALEREWLQRLYFHWATHEHLHFRFDDSHVRHASHHQKFVVIDGVVSFLGGIDICEARWDDRRHRVANRLRVTRGKPQKPYHDVQAYFRGPEIAAALGGVFCDRWRRAGGDPIQLPPRSQANVAGATGRPAPRGALAFPPGPVALSRTDRVGKRARSIHEIRALLEHAFEAAQQLVYAETQYFSSRVLWDALLRRLRQARRPKLEIVLLVNERAEAVKEEIAVGLRQVQIIADLRRAAAETGHAFNAYFTIAEGRARKPTYIHSKLMIVDDRLLTVGSANFTNRSLGVDSEINASWETARGRNRRLEAAIRRTRVSLLMEHIGGRGGAKLARRLARPTGLVSFLDRLVASRRGRLRALPPPSPAQSKAIALLDPRTLPFDPERPD